MCSCVSLYAFIFLIQNILTPTNVYVSVMDVITIYKNIIYPFLSISFQTTWQFFVLLNSSNKYNVIISFMNSLFVFSWSLSSSINVCALCRCVTTTAHIQVGIFTEISFELLIVAIQPCNDNYIYSGPPNRRTLPTRYVFGIVTSVFVCVSLGVCLCVCE